METVQLPIQRDDDDGLILAAPRAPRIAAMVVFGLLAVGLWLGFPSLQAAPLLFAALGLWQATALLKAHELHLDVREHRLSYIHGWRFANPVFSGTYCCEDTFCEDTFCEDTAEAGALRGEPQRLASRAVVRLVIEAHAGDPGIDASRLRSHVLILEVQLPGIEKDPSIRRFQIGYPMGSLAAEQRAQDIAALRDHHHRRKSNTVRAISRPAPGS